MKILHTADWHIGQLFYEYDRSWEHQQFFEWLITTLQEKAVDIFASSENVFDQSNPFAASVRPFYSFLNRDNNPHSSLQIVVTTSNKNSVAKLEPTSPWESLNIHQVGLGDINNEDNMDYEMLFPCIIHTTKSKTGIWQPLSCDLMNTRH